jgi:hypothetical protein
MDIEAKVVDENYDRKTGRCGTSFNLHWLMHFIWQVSRRPEPGFTEHALVKIPICNTSR